MEIEFTNRQNALEVILQGKLDVDSADQLFTTLCNLNSHLNKQVFCINLGELSYIDSTGLGVLIKFLNEVKEAKRQLILFGAIGNIANVFKLARLDKFFNFQTVEFFDDTYAVENDDHISAYLESLGT